VAETESLLDSYVERKASLSFQPKKERQEIFWRMGPARRDIPEVAIEWLDVTIDIKVRQMKRVFIQRIWTGVLLQVCGVDVPLEDRDYVRLYPKLDPMLVSRQGFVLCEPR
jgi:hypothetical protein